MKCKRCASKSVASGFCKTHFFRYVEKKVEKTIADYRLIPEDAKILVAVSGGKDSTVVLYLLKQRYAHVDALAIDEGIAGYRNKTLEDLRAFCAEHKVKLNVVRFQDNAGASLDALVKRGFHNCSVCGTLRRYLLNKHARGYDVIVTGHNLDDEAQSFLMNVMRNQIDMAARLGPVSGIDAREGFVQRVKPLYFIKEKEVTAYAILKGFKIHFVECPYAQFAYRSKVRDFLNAYEEKHPGSKELLLKGFLKLLPKLKKSFAGTLNYCSRCGEPSSKAVCRTCEFLEQIQSRKPLNTPARKRKP